jgi:hypothetical protein
MSYILVDRQQFVGCNPSVQRQLTLLSGRWKRRFLRNLVRQSLLGNIVHEKLKNPRNCWRSTNTISLPYHQRPYVGEWSGMSLLENVILSCLVTRIKPVNVGTGTSIKPFNVNLSFYYRLLQIETRQAMYV